MTEYFEIVPLEPDAQAQLLEEISAMLVESAPESWREIRLTCHVTIAVSTHRLRASTPDATVDIGLPMKAHRAIDRLRNGMYRTGTGTWFSMSLAITADRRWTVEYDYDNEPSFVPALSAGTFAQDADYYPRSPDHTPDWLKQKLAEANPAPRRTVTAAEEIAPDDLFGRVVLTQADQDEILGEVKGMLTEIAPAGWSEIRLTFRTTVEDDAADCVVRTADGVRQPMRVPTDVRLRLDDLRNGMYRKDTGTWFTVTVVCTPPDRHTAEFDYDTEPDFDPPLKPQVYANDLEYYPRSADRIPGWLAAKLR